MKEMFKGKVNSPQTQLSESIDSHSTDIKVLDVSVFPEGPNLAVIGTDAQAETIKYTNINNNILVGCVRGFQGTAKSWDKDSIIARNFTEYDLNAIQENISEINKKQLKDFQDDETHRTVSDAEKTAISNSISKVNTQTSKSKIDFIFTDNSSVKQALPLYTTRPGRAGLMRPDDKLKLDGIQDGANKVTKLSELENDTNFKTEAEIQSMISNASKLKKEVVDSLPTTGKDDVIYLVQDPNGKDNNNYLEYLWLNGKYELIGSTQVDLSGYATKSEIPTKMSQLNNDENYISINNFALQAFSKGWIRVINDFDTMYFRQGLEYIQAANRSARAKSKNFPNGTGKYLVYTHFGLSLQGTYPIGTNANQLIFCLENRKFYYRNGTTTTDCNNGVRCEWNELNEIESPAPDLSPFTQQELEEAFKL